MWISELVFEHLDGGLTKGEVKETLLFEQSSADSQDSDKQRELAEFEINYLDGTRYEGIITDTDGATVYLSWQGEKTVSVYAVKFQKGGVKVYEIAPTRGEIEP